MQCIRKRRGRPRHDIPEIDKGTKELQQKRLQLLEKGQHHIPALAESLLGVLYAHGVISRPLYETGCFFGDLGYRYTPCLGQSFRPRVSVLVPFRAKAQGKGSNSFSRRSDEKMTQAWRAALTVLKGAGPGPYKTVLKVVFYDQDLYTSGFCPFSFQEGEALRRGLSHLNLYFKGELKDMLYKPCDPVQNPEKSTNFPPSLRGLPLSLPP